MRILFLSWRDPKNPKSGGAEVLTKEILKRLADRGHEITWYASDFKKAPAAEVIDGIKIRRWGNVVGVLIGAFFHYWKHKREYDLVVDNFHAYPYLTRFYVAKSKRISLIHEVAGKEIWQRMMPFPVSAIGIWMEKILFRFFYVKDKFITVSRSTKNELARYGIKKENIFIIPQGINYEPIKDLPKKTPEPTLIHFAGMRRLKRVEDSIRAVDLLRKDFPKIQLYITGRMEGRYYKYLKALVWELKLERNVQFVGFLSELVKQELIKQSWINISASIKEGWGLVVTEASALGTPSVVYNVPGYRDSVKHHETGLLTIKNTPAYMAKAVKRMLLDKKLYTKLQKSALEESRKYTFEKSSDVFEVVLYGATGFRKISLKREPLVSVIIPTLNSAKFLEKTLESVSDQTYKNIEIIVVDGGSRDKTVNIARKFGARVFKGEKGRSAQKNKGAKKASGRLLYFIDSDFVLAPELIRSAVRRLNEKSLDMIAVHNTSDPSVSFWSKVRKFERDFFKFDTHNISPRFLTRKAFNAVGGFNEALIAGEDYDIYNRLVRREFVLGFVVEEEVHLGEPKTLSDVIKKHAFYGKTLKFKKEEVKPELTFAQTTPIRPAYFSKFYRFLGHPILTLGFAVYNTTRFMALGYGYLFPGKKSRRKDRTFHELETYA